MPYTRTATFLRDVLGIQVTLDSIVRFVRACHEPLQVVEEALKTALSQVPVLHQDETDLRVAGHWDQPSFSWNVDA